ncbi:MAG: type II toxin-antitoxin system HicB family antitoxin [Lachnospiraceae bacterium]|nr:type II toxin-antitoxin system HicB family antitoxin [Lachnospiraceae bacterium]
MKYIYTAIIEKVNDNRFECSVPDLPGCISSGNSLDQAIDMITDAASGWLVINEDENNPIRTATPQSELSIPKNAISTLIRIDTIAYRAATDTRSVRKNVSLPAWMANFADKLNINCSQLLQESLRQRFDMLQRQ